MNLTEGGDGRILCKNVNECETSGNQFLILRQYKSSFSLHLNRNFRFAWPGWRHCAPETRHTELGVQPLSGFAQVCRNECFQPQAFVQLANQDEAGIGGAARPLEHDLQKAIERELKGLAWYSPTAYHLRRALHVLGSPTRSSAERRSGRQGTAAKSKILVKAAWSPPNLADNQETTTLNGA